MTNRNRLMLSVALLGCGAITPALAQDNPPAAAASATPAGADKVDDFALPEIVVTAERRTSTEQKTAASISTRSGDELTKQGRYSLANILENVPGITGGAAENTGGSVTGGTDNPAAGLTIRGIQSNVGTGGSITSTAAAAAIYVDGVYNGIGSSYDIDRLEVLRGPQGTLYGRSATSGVVAIHTHNPDTTNFGADLLAQTGSYNLQQFSGAVNIPLIEGKLAVRVSGNRYEKDGFASAEGGYRKTSDARVKLLFTPNDTFSALVGFAVQDNHANVGGVTISQPTPNNYVFTDSAYGPGENHFHQYWAEFNLDLGGVKLTYLPAYKTWKQNTVGVARGDPASQFDQRIQTPLDHFLTQELRLASQNDSKLNWQTGLFFYDNKLHDINQLNLYPSGLQAFRSDSRKRTRNVGVFGEATYAFTDATRLTAGLRYDYTRVRNNQDYTSITGETKSTTGDEGLRTFKNITYKARLEHDLSPVNLVYGSISTGFSPGDVAITTDVTGSPVVVELDAETLTSYEIGSKNRFFGNRLQINGALYYNDYEGYQTAGINLTPNEPNPTFGTIVAPVKVYGAELEMLARPWPDGQIGLNLAYTHARYDGIPEEYQYLFSTNTISGSIPFQANLWLEHSLEIGSDAKLSARGELVYRSGFDAARLTEGQDAAGGRPFVHNSAKVLGNLSATLAFADGRYALTGYVRNVGDVRYKTGGRVNLDSLTGTIIESSTVDLNDPRTWGVTIAARF